MFYPIIRLHSSLFRAPSFQDGERRREIKRAESSADVLLARGDRAGTRRLLVEQVVPRMSLLAPPGREAAQNVLDDLLSILG